MNSSKENIVTVGVWEFNGPDKSNTVRKIITFSIILLVCQNVLQGQENPLLEFTMQDVLAHNDYQKANPFYHAYNHRVAIMEVDLYYDQGQVFVAHDFSELKLERDLESLYLQPLREVIAQYGSPYPDPMLSLSLMLDIKNESDLIMDWILLLVEKYPDVFGTNGDKPLAELIISGIRPPQHTWTSLPACIKMDGRLTDRIPQDMRERVYMVSSSFQNVVLGQYDLVAGLSAEQIVAVREAIQKVHSQNFKIRFWAVPDTFSYWQLQKELGVDIIGCDRLDEIAKYTR